MPVSSLEMAITAASYFLTSGSTRSSRSSSPVTELTSGLPLIDREARFERLDDRGVDRQRHVDRLLHQLDAFGEDARLVGERDAGVDVEHLRARLDLRHRVGDDAAE